MTLQEERIDQGKLLNKIKVYLLVILLQFCSAGFAIIAKFALNKGTSHFTFAVYRNAVAAIVFAPFAFVLERKQRPKMSRKVFLMIMLLGLLDPVIGQNLFYAGMSNITATLTTALCNVVPALTFVIAWILRVEKVNIKKLRSQSKILGTLVTVGGAMIVTLVVGPAIGLPWTNSNATTSSATTVEQHHVIKGALMIGAGCICYSLFYIFQSITLKSYPAGLSLTTLICAIGAIQGTLLTFIVERDNLAIWSIGLDAKLLAYAYGGIISSGVTYYVSGMVMKEKGPVFVTAFSPLSTVTTAILSSFIFAEQLDVGKVSGAIVIVIGLYLVVWGKKNDHNMSSVNQQKSPATNISRDGVKVNDLDGFRTRSEENNV